MGNFEIDARFALGPRQLHLRKDELDSVSTAMLVAAQGRDVENAEGIFNKFPHLNAFQSALAVANGLTRYAHPIQEAYFLANELTCACTGRQAGDLLLEEYQKQHSEVHLELLKSLSWEQTILHHNFQVTNISVLEAKGLRESLKAVTNCLVRWAEVIETGLENVRVNTVRLAFKDGYTLVESEESVRANAIILGELREGDKIALHWGAATYRLNEQQRNDLEEITKRIVKSL